MTEEYIKNLNIKRVGRAHDLSLLKVILNRIKHIQDKNKALNDIRRDLDIKYNRAIGIGTLEEYLLLLKQLKFIKINNSIEVSDLGHQFMSLTNDDFELSEQEKQFLLKTLLNFKQFRQFLGLFCEEEVFSIKDFKSKAKPKIINETYANDIGVNWKTVKVIRSWAKKLNLIEYSRERKIYFPIKYGQVDETTFIKLLTIEYNKIKSKDFNKRVIIDEVRNEVCINHGIRKNNFNQILKSVWNKIPDKICLERASKTFGKEGLDSTYGMYYYITLRNFDD